MNHRLLLCIISLLFLTATNISSQDNQRKPAEINILNAESMEAPYEGMSSDLIRLIGNVRLRHEGALMDCDSAHRFSNTNIVHAFSNVHINQGDTLHLYGDRIIYYGNSRYAEVRGNVRLQDRETTLTTEYLDFDLLNDFGYYPNRGVVINGDNKLESMQGYYYTDEKLFFFKDSVIITNPDYIVRSDTLKYNTVTEVAYFLGPTTIIGDETNIYCENGWYDTKTDISQFNENARVRNNNQLLQADSLYYDNGNGIGKAFINVQVTDTVENIIIKGNYAWFVRDPEQMYVTDKALLIQMSENDTIYMHADTLRTWLQVNRTDIKPPDTMDVRLTENNGTEPPDTMDDDLQIINYEMNNSDFDTDTLTGVKLVNDHTEIEKPDTIRIMVAYYGVRFFSNDMQGKCDSLYYNMRDSIIFMFGEPVVWSDESQLTAEFIEIHSKEGEVDHIVMNNSAFIISEEDQGLYNQIKGKEILGYFQDGELYRVNVSGNAETLYYPAEDEEIIGANKAASSSLLIFLKESKPDRIRFLNKPEATLYPLEDFPHEERFLQNFIWLDDIRPKSRQDVFKR